MIKIGDKTKCVYSDKTVNIRKSIIYLYKFNLIRISRKYHIIVNKIVKKIKNKMKEIGDKNVIFNVK